MDRYGIEQDSLERNAVNTVPYFIIQAENGKHIFRFRPSDDKREYGASENYRNDNL